MGAGFRALSLGLASLWVFEAGFKAIGKAPTDSQLFTKAFTQRSARALANAATRSAIDGSNFGDNLIASIPDVIGQTLGEAFGGVVSEAVMRHEAVLSSATANPVSDSEGTSASTGANGTGFFDAVSGAVDGTMAAMRDGHADWEAAMLSAHSARIDAEVNAKNEARFAADQAVMDEVVVNGIRLRQQDNYNYLGIRNMTLQSAQNQADWHISVLAATANQHRISSYRDETVGPNMTGLWASANIEAGMDMGDLKVTATAAQQRAYEALEWVPVIGSIFTLTSAVEHAQNGRYGTAAIDVALSLPGMKYIGAGGKVIVKGGGKAIEGIGTLFRRGPKVTKDGFTIINKTNSKLAEGVEGIYEFTTANGKKYIGQSSNIARRLAEHGDRIADDSKILFKEIKDVTGLGGKTSREIAEQARIEKFLNGERVSKITKSVLANKVNPIGKARLDVYNQFKHLF